jgi:hypothetical protein
MTAVTQFISQLTDRTHLRRNLIIGVGFITVIAVVLFSANIGDLLNRPTGSRAGTSDEDINRIWESIERQGAQRAAHSKMIAVTDPQTQKRYLYVMGGVEIQESVQQNRPKTVILNTVRRIEIDPVRGSVMPEAVWEGAGSAWGAMKFGHMEFGLAQAGNFLYVVAGDINLPPLAAGQAANQSQLLYSTVERLDLTNPGAGWSVYALLSGVNFYPEVIPDAEGIHVVGGVYGNPFPPLQEDVAATYIEDMLDAPGDAIKWASLDLDEEFVIGGTGIFLKNTKIGEATVGGNTVDLTPLDDADEEDDNNFDFPQTSIPASLGPVAFQIQQANRESFVAPNASSVWTSGAQRTLRIKISGFLPVPQSASFEWRTNPLDDWTFKGTSTNREPQGSDYYFSLITTVPHSGDSNPNNQVRATIQYDNGTSATITSELFTTVERSLTITKPGTGETIAGGDTYHIQWNSTGIPANNLIKFEYSVNGTTWKPAADANGSSVHVNDGDFSWLVPNDPGTSVKLRIWMYSAYNDPRYDAYAESPPFVMTGSLVVSDKLTQSLISGSFVTTVGEHYIINTGNPASSLTNELKSDFIGRLSTTWTPGTVTFLGHLRFYVSEDGSVVPVPQGRYGHKVIKNFANGSLGVIGGATWIKEQEIVTAGVTENFKTFWVIEDAIHPVHQTTPADFSFTFGQKPVGIYSYKFVGNIAYGAYSPTTHRWQGTNEAMATGNRFPNEGISSANYSLKDASGTKGRAFFGLADFPGSPLVVGGLENTIEVPGSFYQRQVVNGKRYFRISAGATSRTEMLSSGAWTHQPTYTERLNQEGETNYKPAYNIQSFALNGKAVAYGGQSNFQLAFDNSSAPGLTHDAHVPDYQFSFGPKTMMFIPAPAGPDFDTTEVWYAMADLGIAGVKADFHYVRVRPGTDIVHPGTQITYTARAYNLNGVELPGAACTWARKSNAIQLGDINPTSGIFTANPNLGAGAMALGGIEATCTLGSITVKGTADIGVYPVGTEPQARLSRVEVTPPSAIIPVTSKRDFRFKAYDQFGTELTTGLGITWTIQPNDIASFKDGITNQNLITLIAEKAGSYPGALKVGVTATGPNGTPDTIFGTADITIPENLFEDGSSAESFASDYMVASGTGNQIKAVYHYGGIGSNSLQFLGLFGGGNLTGTLDVVTSPIAPDGFYGSDVTLTLQNALGEPVFQDSNGNRFAASIDTSRSPSPVVTTDQSFRINPADGTLKKERVELIGEPFADAVAGGEYVYFDTNGVARFRIYSNTPTTSPMTVTGHILSEGGYSFNSGSITDTLSVANIPGVPSQLESSITADKLKVAADGLDKSTVTVSLKDYLGTNVNGYHVKLTSSRGAVDSISPATRITANGAAVFEIKSNIKGLATIRAFFAPNATDLADHPTPLLETLTLDFSASIASLTPNIIHQGDILDSVEAIGNQTTWETTKTTVEYVSPSRTGLAISAASQHIKANGISKTVMTITAPEYPNRQINLTLSGSGSLLGGTSVTTNAQGTATFQYQSGVVPGIIKIKAQVAGGINPAGDEVWFMLEDNRDHPYELVVFASPAGNLAPGESTVVRGAIYEYVGTQKVLVTDSATLSFASDKGLFNPASDGTSAGIAQSTFTRALEAGPAQILVTATFDTVKLGTRMVINQTDSTSDLTGQLPVILDAQRLTVAGLTATETAVVGTWLFRTITVADTGEVEVADYPLQVMATGATGGPRLTSVNPSTGYRNTDNFDVTITGANAFFQSTSVVEFSPIGGSPDAAQVEVKSIERISSDELVATLKISNTAAMGFWNVKVTTGTRVAELAGDLDFLVTTPNNIVIDVAPSPNRIPRDGKATSQVTTFVGRLDPLTGLITKLPNVEVVFGFVGGDAGKLEPIKDTTDDDGLVINTYTTDAGDESDDVQISATVVIDGVPSSNTGLIIKEVDAGYNFLLTADPSSLPATGGSANLIATVVDRLGNPVVNGTPVQFIVVGVGFVTPANTSVTGGQGRATSLYQVGAQTTPQLVRLVAKATVAGVGNVYSNEVLMPVGYDPSQYHISLTASPASIEAGTNNKSTVTATLMFGTGAAAVPVRNWPITFSLNYQQAGDYLTVLSGTTNDSGQLVTQFAPGYFTGNVLVTAAPIALSPGSVVITKTAGQIVSQALSTISAVPKFVPADNAAFSVITVTVRNANNVGLANKQVSLTASLGTIEPPANSTTNALGQATFRVKSGTVGTSNLTATVDSISLTTQAFFVPVGSVVAVMLDTIVPLEAKSYERLVKLYLREPVSGAQPTIDESYYTDTTDHVVGLPTIYLKPNVSYSYWAKGRFHLARVKPVQAAVAGNVAINFTATHRGTAKGLLIGDLSPDVINNLPTLWHDNAINAVDVVKIIQSWFRNSYEADLNNDGLVNSADFTYWSFNYGSGENLP